MGGMFLPVALPSRKFIPGCGADPSQAQTAPPTSTTPIASPMAFACRPCRHLGRVHEPGPYPSERAIAEVEGSIWASPGRGNVPDLSPHPLRVMKRSTSARPALARRYQQKPRGPFRANAATRKTRTGSRDGSVSNDPSIAAGRRSFRVTLIRCVSPSARREQARRRFALRRSPKNRTASGTARVALSVAPKGPACVLWSDHADRANLNHGQHAHTVRNRLHFGQLQSPPDPVPQRPFEAEPSERS